MKIRVIERDDLPRCAQLYAEIFSAPPYGEGWTYGRALEHLEELLSGCNSSCYVAEKSGHIVGFAFCSFHSWWYGKVMRIEEQGVDFRLQRLGIGTRLLEHCLETGRRLHDIAAVEVLTPRTLPALDFYTARGFQSAGRELLSRRL
jgi:GNAT superfamily N-acetyltransferase